MTKSGWVSDKIPDRLIPIKSTSPQPLNQIPGSFYSKALGRIIYD